MSNYERLDFAENHSQLKGKHFKKSEEKKPCKRKNKTSGKDGARQCEAYMYVDLFPNLRMKRDIQEAKRNLRKVGLSSSAESVVEKQKELKKTLCKIDSISHESVHSTKEVESTRSRERFKHALTRWMQHIGKTSSKQQREKQEVRHERLSNRYCSLNDVTDVSDVTNSRICIKKHGYDVLHRWNPLAMNGHNNGYEELNTPSHASGGTNDLRYGILCKSEWQGAWPVTTDRPIRKTNGLISASKA